MATKKEHPKDTPIHLVTGNDEYTVEAKARELVHALCPESEQALGLETVDGAVDKVEGAEEALKHCLSSLQTIGFFGGSKVTWLKNGVMFGADAVISKSEQVKELAAALADEITRGLPDGQYLVISAPKLDKRSVLFKACSSAGSVQEFSHSAKSHEQEAGAEQLARKAFSERGVQLDQRAFRLFLEKTGIDTRQLLQEVEKLSLYAGEGGSVSTEDVERLTTATRERAGWDLQDAMGERNLGKALYMLRGLLSQKASPIGLLIQLVSRLRELMILRAALDEGWVEYRVGDRNARARWSSDPAVDELLGSLASDPRKIHWFRVGRLLEQASNFSGKQLMRMHAYAVKTQDQMTGSSRLDAGLLLELFLLRCLASKRRAVGRASV